VIAVDYWGMSADQRDATGQPKIMQRAVPPKYAELDLEDYGYIDARMIKAGVQFYDLQESSNIREAIEVLQFLKRYARAVEAVNLQGYYHYHPFLKNIQIHPVTGDIRLIDFEHIEKKSSEEAIRDDLKIVRSEVPVGINDTFFTFTETLTYEELEALLQQQIEILLALLRDDQETRISLSPLERQEMRSQRGLASWLGPDVPSAGMREYSMGYEELAEVSRRTVLGGLTEGDQLLLRSISQTVPVKTRLRIYYDDEAYRQTIRKHQSAFFPKAFSTDSYKLGKSLEESYYPVLGFPAPMATPSVLAHEAIHSTIDEFVFRFVLRNDFKQYAAHPGLLARFPELEDIRTSLEALPRYASEENMISEFFARLYQRLWDAELGLPARQISLEEYDWRYDTNMKSLEADWQASGGEAYAHLDEPFDDLVASLSQPTPAYRRLSTQLRKYYLAIHPKLLLPGLLARAESRHKQSLVNLPNPEEVISGSDYPEWVRRELDAAQLSRKRLDRILTEMAQFFTQRAYVQDLHGIQNEFHKLEEPIRRGAEDGMSLVAWKDLMAKVHALEERLEKEVQSLEEQIFRGTEVKSRDRRQKIPEKIMHYAFREQMLADFHHHMNAFYLFFYTRKPGDPGFFENCLEAELKSLRTQMAKPKKQRTPLAEEVLKAKLTEMIRKVKNKIPEIKRYEVTQETSADFLAPWLSHYYSVLAREMIPAQERLRKVEAALAASQSAGALSLTTSKGLFEELDGILQETYQQDNSASFDVRRNTYALFHRYGNVPDFPAELQTRYSVQLKMARRYANAAGFSYYAYYKPSGVETAHDVGPADRQNMFKAFTESTGRNGDDFFPVGPASRRTEGLILFTDDSKLAAAYFPSLRPQTSYMLDASGFVSPEMAEQLSVRVTVGRKHRRISVKPVSVRILTAASAQSTVEIVMRRGETGRIEELLEAHRDLFGRNGIRDYRVRREGMEGITLESLGLHEGAVCPVEGASYERLLDMRESMKRDMARLEKNDTKMATYRYLSLAGARDQVVRKRSVGRLSAMVADEELRPRVVQAMMQTFVMHQDVLSSQAAKLLVRTASRYPDTVPGMINHLMRIRPNDQPVFWDHFTGSDVSELQREWEKGKNPVIAQSIVHALKTKRTGYLERLRAEARNAAGSAETLSGVSGVRTEMRTAPEDVLFADARRFLELFAAGDASAASAGEQMLRQLRNHDEVCQSLFQTVNGFSADELNYLIDYFHHPDLQGQPLVSAQTIARALLRYHWRYLGSQIRSLFLYMEPGPWKYPFLQLLEEKQIPFWRFLYQVSVHYSVARPTQRTPEYILSKIQPAMPLTEPQWHGFLESFLSFLGAPQNADFLREAGRCLAYLEYYGEWESGVAPALLKHLPENPAHLAQGIQWDLASGLNYREYLRNFNPLTVYEAFDNDPIAVSWLRTRIELLGVGRHFRVREEDIRQVQKPERPLALVRMKNVFSYVKGFEDKFHEMLGVDVHAGERDWFEEGGKIVFEFDRNTKGVGIFINHLILLSPIVETLLERGWTVEYELTGTSMYNLSFTKPGSGQLISEASIADAKDRWLNLRRWMLFILREKLSAQSAGNYTGPFTIPHEIATAETAIRQFFDAVTANLQDVQIDEETLRQKIARLETRTEVRAPKAMTEKILLKDARFSLVRHQLMELVVSKKTPLNIRHVEPLMRAVKRGDIKLSDHDLEVIAVTEPPEEDLVGWGVNAAFAKLFFYEDGSYASEDDPERKKGGQRLLTHSSHDVVYLPQSRQFVFMQHVAKDPAKRIIKPFGGGILYKTTKKERSQWPPKRNDSKWDMRQAYDKTARRELIEELEIHPKFLKNLPFKLVGEYGGFATRGFKRRSVYFVKASKALEARILAKQKELRDLRTQLSQESDPDETAYWEARKARQKAEHGTGEAWDIITIPAEDLLVPVPGTMIAGLSQKYPEYRFSKTLLKILTNDEFQAFLRQSIPAGIQQTKTTGRQGKKRNASRASERPEMRVDQLKTEIQGYLTRIEQEIAAEPWKFYSVPELGEQDVRTGVEIQQELTKMARTVVENAQAAIQEPSSVGITLENVRHASRQFAMILHLLNAFQRRELEWISESQLPGGSKGQGLLRHYLLEWEGIRYPVGILTRRMPGSEAQRRIAIVIFKSDDRQDEGLNVAVLNKQKHYDPNQLDFLRIDFAPYLTTWHAELDIPNAVRVFQPRKYWHREIVALSSQWIFDRFLERMDRKLEGDITHLPDLDVKVRVIWTLEQQAAKIMQVKDTNAAGIEHWMAQPAQQGIGRKKKEALTLILKLLKVIEALPNQDFTDVVSIRTAAFHGLFGLMLDYWDLNNDFFKDIADVVLDYLATKQVGRTRFYDYQKFAGPSVDGSVLSHRWPWILALSVSGGAPALHQLEAELESVQDAVYDIGTGRNFDLIAYQDILLEAIGRARTYNHEDVRVKEEILRNAADVQASFIQRKARFWRSQDLMVPYKPGIRSYSVLLAYLTERTRNRSSQGHYGRLVRERYKDMRPEMRTAPLPEENQFFEQNISRIEMRNEESTGTETAIRMESRDVLAEALSPEFQALRSRRLPYQYNLTRFYRQNDDPFNIMAFNRFIDGLAARAANGRKIRILDAGCSMGAMTYTLGIELLKRGIRTDLVGVDRDPQMIEIARGGVFRKDTNPQAPKATWAAADVLFDLIPQWEEVAGYIHRTRERYTINPAVKSLTQFQVLDLRDSGKMQQLAETGLFDGIISTNVFYYLRTLEERQKAVENLGHVSKSDALLLFSGRINDRWMLYDRDQEAENGFRLHENRKQSEEQKQTKSPNERLEMRQDLPVVDLNRLDQKTLDHIARLILEQHLYGYFPVSNSTMVTNVSDSNIDPEISVLVIESFEVYSKAKRNIVAVIYRPTGHLVAGVIGSLVHEAAESRLFAGYSRTYEKEKGYIRRAMNLLLATHAITEWRSAKTPFELNTQNLKHLYSQLQEQYPHLLISEDEVFHYARLRNDANQIILTGVGTNQPRAEVRKKRAGDWLKRPEFAMALGSVPAAGVIGIFLFGKVVHFFENRSKGTTTKVAADSQPHQKQRFEMREDQPAATGDGKQKIAPGVLEYIHQMLRLTSLDWKSLTLRYLDRVIDDARTQGNVNALQIAQQHKMRLNTNYDRPLTRHLASDFVVRIARQFLRESDPLRIQIVTEELGRMAASPAIHGEAVVLQALDYLGPLMAGDTAQLKAAEDFAVAHLFDNKQVAIKVNKNLRTELRHAPLSIRLGLRGFIANHKNAPAAIFIPYDEIKNRQGAMYDGLLALASQTAGSELKIVVYGGGEQDEELKAQLKGLKVELKDGDLVAVYQSQNGKFKGHSVNVSMNAERLKKQAAEMSPEGLKHLLAANMNEVWGAYLLAMEAIRGMGEKGGIWSVTGDFLRAELRRYQSSLVVMSAA
jgi:chemotaxis methyl-accepting protein methylase/16S rRNA U516 pseudouridylate synthase RsuA-like enzyme